MSWFQLDAESIAARARTVTAPVPTLGASICRGIIGFTLLSVAGFIPWAVFGRTLYRQIGEAGMYAVCALVFIGLSAPLLHRLVIGPGSLRRFYLLFTPAFIVYSIGWIGAWMTLRGHLGGAVGLFFGTALMGTMIAAAFDAWPSALKIIAALFLLNAAGYFIGGIIEGALIQSVPLTAKLLWGVCYGVGFGAGLGVSFHLAQTRAISLLR